MSVEDALIEVQLLAVPLVLRERSRQHGADLLREMTLLRAGLADDRPSDPDDGTDGDGRADRIPDRLLQLAQELEAVYGPYLATSGELIEQALDRGLTSLDVVYRLPAEAAEFLVRIRALLTEVDEYCASDDYLLALAPPADIAAYREWSIGQVLDQLAGEPATPWPVWAARHATA